MTAGAEGIAAALFNRVIVGVDRSEESLEATRQAAALADGQLTLLAAYDIAHMMGATGTRVPSYLDEDVQREHAEEALQRARELVSAPSAEGKVARGSAWDKLIGEAERKRATLIVVGSHETGRMAGVILGSTATEVVHKAPCSVLLARKSHDTFPGKIVVGIDGSPESAAAYEVGLRLAERFNVALSTVAALGGKGIDEGQVDSIGDASVAKLPEDPVSALVGASAEAGMLLIASRGLHGVKALGSVSERVAHQANSSVLIVRSPN
jgi:nucleotide-binding universal stress UspA family protein